MLAFAARLSGRGLRAKELFSYIEALSSMSDIYDLGLLSSNMILATFFLLFLDPFDWDAYTQASYTKK